MAKKQKTPSTRTERIETRTNKTMVALRTKKGTVLRVKATRTSPALPKKGNTPSSPKSSGRKKGKCK